MTVVREFHRAFNLPAPTHPPLRPNPDLVRLRMRLIREEFDEVMVELATLTRVQDADAVNEAFQRLLKELADLRYVTEGCAVSLGLPIDAAYAEVHRSNMSKLGEDGLPIYDAGGKVLKGPDYQPANMERFVPPIINQED